MYCNLSADGGCPAFPWLSVCHLIIPTTAAGHYKKPVSFLKFANDEIVPVTQRLLNW